MSQQQFTSLRPTGGRRCRRPRSLSYEAVEPRRMLVTVTSVHVNAGIDDPDDLPHYVQPTSWQQQRSELRRIEVRFSEPVQDVQAEDVALTNLTLVAQGEPGGVLLADGRLEIHGDTLSIDLESAELSDGLYSLDILPTVRGQDGSALDGNQDGVEGDSFTFGATLDSAFYQLTADFNGDGGVSILDFPAFAYWFGTRLPDAPRYMDLDHDGGVFIFDFPIFASSFGQAISQDLCNTLEAQQLAIEVSNELVAPPELTDRICQDLVDIRAAFPEVASITHRPTWANQILVSLTDEAIERFEQGTFDDLDLLNQQYGAGDMHRIGHTSILVVSFSTLYNMSLMSDIYANVDSVETAQPNHYVGDGDDIVASPPTYVLSRGWGDCLAGCIFRETWTFSVDDGLVTLLAHESPLSTVH